MVWIESHQSLKDHPKTRKLARILDTSLPATIGHLQCLWWWSVDYAQDGDLSRHDRLDIAIGGEWDGDPDVFVDALTKAGFIDLEDDGSLWIHDWDDYIGKLLDRRKANAERAKTSRVRRKSEQQTPDAAPESPQHTPDVTPQSAQDAEAVRAACAQRAETSAQRAVLPTNQPTNRTEPTEPTNLFFGAQAAPDGGSDGEPGGESGPRRVLSQAQQGRFERWYAAYPKKRARLEAEKAWAKIRPAPDDAMTDAMIETVKVWSSSQDWAKDGGAYIPHPATWLNKGRYTDEPPGVIRPAKDPNVLERGLARAG